MSSDAQRIEIAVESNVKFVVEVESSCKEWITHFSTRALNSNFLSFDIKANDSYEDRTGRITIRQPDGNYFETVDVIQAAKDGLFVTKTDFDLSWESQEIEVEVQSNVEFEVLPEVDWIHVIETRGLSSSIVILNIEENHSSEARGGLVQIVRLGGGIKESITVKQERQRFIKDQAFYEYLLGSFDRDMDGMLSLQEMEAITYIRVYNKDISSLQGIEFMPKLKEIYCPNLNLDTLDLSRNHELLFVNVSNYSGIDGEVTQYKNHIEYINISQCPLLAELRINVNLLTSIDVTKNTDLRILECAENKLKELDVSYNTSLGLLHCDANNLSLLDISNCQSLMTLDCSQNNLTYLDVTNLCSLSFLKCSECHLSDLDVSNCTSLSDLICDENELTKLDISKNRLLRSLSCSNNRLKGLDVSSNRGLSQLICSYNKLSDLDILNNPFLEILRCSGNQITQLNTTNNKRLKQFSCDYNLISSLDLSHNEAIQRLYCRSNSLKELDVSRLSQLNELVCSNNKISKLDLSNNLLLGSLFCENNCLTTLLLQNNAKLSSLSCYGNLLTSLDVSTNLVLNWIKCSPMNDSNGINTLAVIYIKGNHFFNYADIPPETELKVKI